MAGNVLQGTWSADSVCGVALVAAGTTGNAEILAKQRLDYNLSAIDYGAGLVLRGSGAHGSHNGYHVSLDLGGQVVNVGKNVNGSYSSVVSSVSFTFDYDDWVWVRFRVNGTTIQVRWWLDGDSEPGTWNVDTTDSDVSDPGWVGVYTYDGRADQYDWFSVAKGSGTAPSPPEAAADITVSPAQATITTTGYAPTVTVPEPVTVSPATATITATGYAPTVDAGNNITVSPATATTTTTGFAPTIDNTGDNLKVFPGAVGFGTDTTAGRGGTLYKVTSLSDSGAGTLRAALEASGTRIVVFEISGEIELSSDITITNDDLMVAGQTAPEPGITLTGYGVRIQASDILIQHIRIRPGDDGRTATGDWDNLDCLQINSGSNIVIDHCSFSWGIDENVSLWGSNITDVTFSNCIISEALDDSAHTDGTHSKGLITGGSSDNPKKLTIIECLFAHNKDRNPQIKGGTSTIVSNNIMYNCGDAYSISNMTTNYVSAVTLASYLGNVFLEGPEYSATAYAIKAETNLYTGSKFYVDDNIYPDHSSLLLSDSGGFEDTSAPITLSGYTPMASSSVVSSVLASVGATPAIRDAVDRRIVAEVSAETGSSKDTSVGLWPTYTSTTRTFDEGADPNGDSDSDGYTNIEDLLHAAADYVENGSGDITCAPATATATVAGLTPTVSAGSSVVVRPAPASITATGLAPTTNATADLTVQPAPASITATGLAPTTNATADLTVQPAAASITATGLAPVVGVTDNVTVSPGAAAVTTTGYVPTIGTSADLTVSPAAATATVTGLTPTVDATANLAVAPAQAEVTATGYAPTVNTSADLTVSPATADTIVTGLTPTVFTTANLTVAPAQAGITATGYAPTADITADLTVSPSVASITATGYNPVVSVDNSLTVQPDAAEVVAIGYAPHVVAPVSVEPAVAAITATGYAPAVTASANRTVQPAAAAITATGSAPTIATTANEIVSPATALVTAVGYAPAIGLTEDLKVSPATASITTSGFTPRLIVGDTITVYPDTTGAIIIGHAPTVRAGLALRKSSRKAMASMSTQRRITSATLKTSLQSSTIRRTTEAS